MGQRGARFDPVMWLILTILGVACMATGSLMAASGYDARRRTRREHRQGVGASRLAFGILLMTMPAVLCVWPILWFTAAALGGI